MDERLIPEWLKVGQALDQRIAAAHSEGKSPKLTDRCRATLTRLQAVFARSEYGRVKRPSETLDQVLQEDRGVSGRRSLDVVILAWAHLKQSSPIPSELKKDAFEAFRADRPAYEAVLGDVLGERFLDAFDCYCSDAGLYSAADEVRIRRRGLRLRKVMTTPSGFGELDLFTGGLLGYVLVSGNPATDAAGLALNLVYRAVEVDPSAAALVVSLRRTMPEIVDRLMGIALAVPFSTLANLDNTQTTRAFDDGERSDVLGRLGILSHLGGEKSLDFGQWSKLIANRAQKLVDRTGATRLLVLIDSLHEVTFAPEDRSPTFDNQESHHFTESELDRLRVRLVQNLLRWGGPLDPAIIAVNKSTKVPTGRRMGLDDVYGGVDIIYPATTILLLDRDERAPTGDSVPHVLTVAKAENGVTGEVPLIYKPSTRSFTQKGSGSGGAATASNSPFATQERASGKRGGKP